jgi:hypothetical protein
MSSIRRRISEINQPAARPIAMPALAFHRKSRPASHSTKLPPTAARAAL